MADENKYPNSVGKDTEIWKAAHSVPGLLASSWGRVVLPPSYAPIPHGGYRAYLPKPTYGAISRAKKTAAHTYRLIMVRGAPGEPRQKPRKVHQLVCEAFHGPRPDPKSVVLHLDENAHNNRPENLRWGTQKENLNMPGFVAFCRTRFSRGVGDRND